MAKNVMKLLKPSPHRARNDFDLSHRHVFDANFGELLPATCIETVPGDNIELHASDLLRAIPFVSSPFLRAKQHLDVWFVPYHDLWHQFDAFMTKKSEPVSSAFKGAAYCPYVYQYDLHYSINYLSLQNKTDVVGRPLADRSYYLLQLLGYGDIEHKYGSKTGSDYNSFKVNPFRLAAYNYIWYNEYRQQYYDDGSRLMWNTLNNPAALFNFDRLSCDTEANASVFGATGTTELIGAMCQIRYRTWKKDLFTGVLPNTQFGSVSTINAGNIQGLTGTFVGTPATLNVAGQYTGNAVNPNDTNAWAPEISSDYGRWNGENIPDLNPDDLADVVLHSGTSTIQHDNGDGTHDSEGLDPRIDINGSYQKAYHNHVITYDESGHRHYVNGSSISYTPSGSITYTGSSPLGFDVLALRKAEAVQIWRENALRAGNHIKDNMLAHYGVASDFQDHRPTYLGSVSAPLNIGDIATTANSSSGVNTTVGDIAGKGLSSLSEKVFKFHAKDFGVIMVMFSMLPEAEYDAVGIERNNQLLEPEDFFVPEYENLGLEPVSVINLAGGAYGEPTEALVYGYAPRYYGYKTKLDKTFGAFTGNGIFRTWTSQRSDIISHFNSSYTTGIPLGYFYVNPALFDANFNVGISTSPQFLCDMYFDVDAVRPMSVIGLPFS